MNSRVPWRMQHQTAHCSLVAVAIAGLLIGGCSKEASIPTHPVKGTVTVNNKAAEGVYLQFHGVGPASSPAPHGAKTEADGSYLVPLHASGEYLLTAFWPSTSVEDGETVEGNDRFRGSYRDLNHPVTKVTIHEGQNTLPVINLKLR